MNKLYLGLAAFASFFGVERCEWCGNAAVLVVHSVACFDHEYLAFEEHPSRIDERELGEAGA